jgi:hypothetical protein
MTICLATAPGSRRGLLWIRWEAGKKQRNPHHVRLGSQAGIATLPRNRQLRQ